MDFQKTYPDFAAIEQQVRRARLERSIAVGQVFANLAQKLGHAVTNALSSMQRGYEAERDRRAIEADAFLKRSVPRY